MEKSLVTTKPRYNEHTFGHAASHAEHEKRVTWFSVAMHACGSVPIVMELRLPALRAAGAPLLNAWDIINEPKCKGWSWCFLSPAALRSY